MSEFFELVLLRHAHAEPLAPGQHDQARPLSARGREEADAAATWLHAHGLPARALCSPAVRTLQTAERALAGSAVTAMMEPAIYEASPGDLLEVVEAHRAAGPSLLLVGHNPGMESLVALLATGQSGDHRGMPPGGIAVLALPADQPLEPGAARLTAFWSP